MNNGTIKDGSISSSPRNHTGNSNNSSGNEKNGHDVNLDIRDFVATLVCNSAANNSSIIAGALVDDVTPFSTNGMKEPHLISHIDPSSTVQLDPKPRTNYSIVEISHIYEIWIISYIRVIFM